MQYKGPDRRGTINGLERDTYHELEDSQKLNVLYDSLSSLHNLVYSLMQERCPQQAAECAKRFDAVDDRLEAFDRRSWVNKAFSFAGGIVGGFVALVSKWILAGR